MRNIVQAQPCSDSDPIWHPMLKQLYDLTVQNVDSLLQVLCEMAQVSPSKLLSDKQSKIDFLKRLLICMTNLLSGISFFW